MESLFEELVENFRRFPGVGPRQARRFVYHLLRTNHRTIDTLAEQIKKLKQAVAQCPDCFRFFYTTYNLKPSPADEVGKTCPLCADNSRDASLLMVVEKDMDLENVERTGAYRGRYFVLGGLVPALEKNPERLVRLGELTAAVAARQKDGLKEIILALAANPEGDYTAQYLRQILNPNIETRNIKISMLGRGLSTGTELEYSDADTLKNALKHRE